MEAVLIIFPSVSADLLPKARMQKQREREERERR